jgi:hypothetical protein
MPSPFVKGIPVIGVKSMRSASGTDASAGKEEKDPINIERTSVTITVVFRLSKIHSTGDAEAPHKSVARALERGARNIKLNLEAVMHSGTVDLGDLVKTHSVVRAFKGRPRFIEVGLFDSNNVTACRRITVTPSNRFRWPCPGHVGRNRERLPAPSTAVRSLKLFAMRKPLARTRYKA